MTKKNTIAVIRGDGIGPELVDHALRLLGALPVSFTYVNAEAGFGTYKKHGTSLPEETIEVCKNADAILFGAVTTPPHVADYFSPIVRLRKLLQLYANVRPFFSLPIDDSVEDLDFVIVRENTEDLYGGNEREIEDGYIAERVITRTACVKILTHAFQLASARRSKVTVVHKANVLRLTDGLFLDCATQVASKFPQVTWTDMLVDSCAMQLIRNPRQFDVLVTTNMFGDILSDEAAALVGGLGVVASANIGDSQALFEPVHGSAPKYEGLDKVNPSATFFATSMMLDHLGFADMAGRLKRTVIQALSDGVRTRDVGGKYATSGFTDAIIDKL